MPTADAGPITTRVRIVILSALVISDFPDNLKEGQQPGAGFRADISDGNVSSLDSKEGCLH